MRLIDADDLEKEFEWLHSVVHESRKFDVEDSLNRVKNAPTIDAVEVVRCKDCKHKKCVQGLIELSDAVLCRKLDVLIKYPSECFCYFGERRDDNAAD